MANAPEKLIVAHFGELWLRGKNRPAYIALLKKNMARQLAGEDLAMEHKFDRIVIRPAKESDTSSICARLSRVFGISKFEVAYATEPSLKAITKAGEMVLDDAGPGKTVRINSHRSHKGFDFDSVDIIGELSDAAERKGSKASIKGFDTEINVSVTKDVAYVSGKGMRGAGGLPVGSSGKGVVLFSGGIDSPVAAWYAMKRGIEPVYVHIHGFPDASSVEGTKIKELLGTLAGYCPRQRVYYVPSHIFQVAAMPARKYELILLKAFMLRLADKVAKREGAGSIVTGESLGQVASQTMSNLLAEQQGVKALIVRPLVGFDKDEIIRVARQISTYDASIKPYKDVCSINATRPATTTTVEKMKVLTKRIGMQSVISRSLKKAEITESAG